MRYYDSLAETRDRLSDVIVMVGLEPRYVLEITVKRGTRDNDPSNILLRTVKLPMPTTGHEQVLDVELTDPELNIRNFNLGYFNPDQKTNCAYIQRMPIRKYKQGINRSNVFLSWQSAEDEPYERDRLGINSFYTNEGLKNSLIGEFPTLEAVKKNLREGAKKTEAFHKYFAIGLDSFREDYILFYKMQKVAFGDIEHFVLPSDYMYLREVLVKEGLKVYAKG